MPRQNMFTSSFTQRGAQKRMQGGIMKPVIIVCTCGRVRKFGQWIFPTKSQAETINGNTYRRDYQKCHICTQKVEIEKTLFPYAAA